ncbi:alpha/beta hydrolase [Actinomadura meridiana]|uniref:Alpha/beta hydrolase n=1 Tax=Actinomadura meridiana TaxID=559626 RepID=A0ABP8CMB1_9ACTN
MTTISSTLRVPDGELYFEVRGQGRLIALVAAPMDAAEFAPMADLLSSGFTVLTTDPRGINRSRLDDPEQDSTPVLRADDVARLIEHVDAGPAVALGSSGGACTVLALAQDHPERVAAVLAHEPPLIELLDDRDEFLKGTEEMIAAYRDGDVIGAWRKFMAQAGFQFPEGALEQMFGGERPAQQVADERRWFEHELRETARWRPDVDALKAGDVRVVIGIGAESRGQFCDRTSRALAAALGVEPAIFPGGHVAFTEDPVAFTVRFGEVIDEIN